MDKLNITVLDKATLGDDIEFSAYKKYGSIYLYDTTSEQEVYERCEDTDVVIVNKVKMNEYTLGNTHRLKLICLTATGYDNVDIDYCRKKGIGVCNVKGYSTDSVAQLTVAMVLSLANNLSQFDSFVKSGQYTSSGLQNKVTPVFNELNKKTWGVVGYGGIGKKVAEIARAFGCNVVVYKKTPEAECGCVTLEQLCRCSDIIILHVPLNSGTRGMIDSTMIASMKPNAIVVNTARGAVIDEGAITEAIEEDRIGGLGVDVYSKEPLQKDSPFNRIMDRPNVIFTPHMAWGAYEARVRCMDEIVKNIDAFLCGEHRNRVD